MGNSLGERTLFTIGGGRTINVSADGAPKFKAGGVTIDWSTVAAISGSDVVYEDNVTVKVGEKALRYGTILYRLSDGRYGPATAATISGGATLKRGETYIVFETMLEEENMSNHPGVIDGGRVFRDRLVVGGANPTLAQVEAAMPGIVYALD